MPITPGSSHGSSPSMTLDAALVDELAREIFPARADCASFEYVSAEVRAPSWGARRDELMLIVTARLVLYTRLPNGELEISDVKEQEVAFASADEDFVRLRAYLEAFVDVLSRAFATDEANATWETLMPHDFVHAEVLRLKTAHTKEDFVKAFERPSRFGRWLARGVASSAGADTAALPPEDALAPPSAVDDDKSL